MAIVHDVQVNEVIQKSTHQVAWKKMEETMFNKRILRNTNTEGLGGERVLLETLKRRGENREINPGFYIISEEKEERGSKIEQ